MEDIAGLVARPYLRGQHAAMARSPALSRHVRALYVGLAWPTLSFPPKIAPVTRATLLSRTGSYRGDSVCVGKPSGRSLIQGCMHKRVYLEHGCKKNSRDATLVASPFTALLPGAPLFACTDICAFPAASPSWKNLKKQNIELPRGYWTFPLFIPYLHVAGFPTRPAA